MWKPKSAQLTLVISDIGQDVTLNLATTTDGDVTVTAHGGSTSYMAPFGAKWLLKAMEIMREIAEASK